MKQIVFSIGDGKVEIEAKGFTGSACEAATKAFEDVLGGNITEKKRTADYYKKESVKLTQGAK